jgi:hypothetical protein
LVWRAAVLMNSDDLDSLGVELMAADEADDSRRLAAIAWELFGAVGSARADIERLHSILRSLPGGSSRRARPDPQASAP